jgi:hypothetical protein
MRQAAIHRISDILHSHDAVNNLNSLPRASRLLFRFLQRVLRRNHPPLPESRVIEEKKGFRIYRKTEGLVEVPATTRNKITKRKFAQI